MSQYGSFLTNNGPAGYVQTLTGDSGAAVVPTAGNINVFGAHGINTSGAASTLTVAIDNAIVLGDLAVLGAGVDALTLTTGDLTITSGNINLPTTAAAGVDGVINVNAARFIHSFGGTNTFVGNQTGNFTLTGFSSVGVGAQSLTSVTSGPFNTMVGYLSGNAITSGGSNVGVGSAALSAVTTTGSNTAIGASALNTITTGANNIAVGYFAGSAYATNESDNIAIGNVGTVADGGTIRIGTNATHTSVFVAGIDGVDVGNVAKVVTMDSDELGTATITAGTGITVTPTANTITIASTVSSAITLTGDTGGPLVSSSFTFTGSPGGSSVSFSGAGTTLSLNVTDSLTNTLVGSGAGNGSLTGINNAGLGSSALSALTSGIKNTAVGYQAGTGITSGSENIAIGFATLNSALTTNRNTIVGANSCYYLVSGAENASLGWSSLASCSSGSFNTAIGSQAAYSLGTGSYNTTLGYYAGSSYGAASASNITINNVGASESNTLRIGAATGTGNQQLSSAYICGIDGVNVGSVAKVLTMASDQIGTATITAGTGITVTPTANTITIDATNTGFTWTVISGASQALVAGNGYIANNAGTTVFTLPATAAIGDTFRVTGINNATGWQVAENAGQTIYFGTSNATTTTGTLTSSATRDAIEMICVATDTDFQVISSVGNITIT